MGTSLRGCSRDTSVNRGPFWDVLTLAWGGVNVLWRSKYMAQDKWQYIVSFPCDNEFLTDFKGAFWQRVWLWKDPLWRGTWPESHWFLRQISWVGRLSCGPMGVFNLPIWPSSVLFKGRWEHLQVDGEGYWYFWIVICPLYSSVWRMFDGTMTLWEFCQLHLTFPARVAYKMHDSPPLQDLPGVTMYT